MKLKQTVAAILFAAASLCAMPGPAHAAVNAQNLGAKYDATAANVNFRLYSSRATRIELSIYASATATTPAAKYVMTKDAANVWSTSAPVATLKGLGVTGAIYYGFRA